MAQQSLFYSDINIETHTQMRNFHASGLTVCIACTGATQFYIYHLLEAQNYSFRAQTVLLRNFPESLRVDAIHPKVHIDVSCTKHLPITISV